MKTVVSNSIKEKAEVRKEIIVISIVVALFAIGLLFHDSLRETPYSIGKYLVFITAYLISGWGVLAKAFSNLLRRKFFDENFLMSVATLGAIAIKALPEAVAVMMFYNVGEFMQGLSVRRSRRSIRKLLEIRPDFANLKRNGEIITVSPEEVKPGD